MGVYLYTSNTETPLNNAYIGIPFPTSIVLNKSIISLTTIGQTVQLTATIMPIVSDKTITWSSDDTTIATVSAAGLVTCVTPGECTITATTANGLTATCDVQQTRLPSAYQEVEWIESSGSQYIDTGFNPTGNSEIELDFEVYNTTDGIFGVDSGWMNAMFIVFNTRLFCYGTQYQEYATNYFTNGIKYKLEFKNLTCTLNGTTQFTYTQNAFSSSYSCYLFAKRRSYYIESYSDLKVYSLKLWNNGTLEREFVPCYRIADGVIGLYDLVNDQFYTNQGSGTFTKGSDV